MDKQHYLTDILENPEDDEPRLAYADWLEGLGDPLGEFIRLQVQREQLSSSSSEAERLRERELQLLEEFEPEWTAEIRNLTKQYEFRRGFISSVNMGLKQFLESADSLFDLAPIDSVGLRQCNSQRMKALAECPHLTRVRTLRLARATMDAAAAKAFFHSPYLTRVDRFHADDCQMDATVCRALATAPGLAKLTSLYIGAGTDAKPDVQAIVTHCRHLHSLNLYRSQIGDEGAATIAEGGLNRLEILNLGTTGLTAVGIEALAQSSNLPALKRLDISFGSGAAEYLSGPNIRQLERLAIGFQDLTDSDIQHLAAADLPELRYLSLRRSAHLTFQSIDYLAQSPLLGQLEYLCLSLDKPLRKRDYIALAESPHLGQRPGVLHLPVFGVRDSVIKSLKAQYGDDFFGDELAGTEREHGFVEPSTTVMPAEIAPESRPCRTKPPAVKATAAKKRSSPKRTNESVNVPSTPEWKAAWNAICDRVETRIGEKTAVRFSNYQKDGQGLPVDNLDDVAIRGRAVVVADQNTFWGGEDSQAFESDLLERPSWLDLCSVLHAQIQATLDEQHVFIEGVERVGSKTIDGKRVSKYTLLLGS